MTAVKAIRPLDPNALSASPEEAARFLSVHRRTVDRLIADRILKARKAGRRVLINLWLLRVRLRKLLDSIAERPVLIEATCPGKNDLMAAHSLSVSS